MLSVSSPELSQLGVHIALPSVLPEHLSIITEAENEESCTGLPNSPDNRVVPFTFTTDPTFLLQICKLAFQYGVGVNDGVCAIEDFIELARFVMDEAQAKLLKLNGQFWKARLCLKHVYNQETVEFAQATLEELQQAQMTKHAAKLAAEISSKSES